MTADVTSPRITPLTLTSARYTLLEDATYIIITLLALISSLSQAATKAGESSDDFSQGATAAVPVETTVISKLVLTSILLLPGDIERALL